MNTQQFPSPDLIEQIIEPPYEPIRDIQSLAQFQAASMVSMAQFTVTMAGMSALMTMFTKALRVALT